MQGQWNHGRPYYRCKSPSDYGVDPQRHPRSVYVKEGAVVPRLDDWLASRFDDEYVEATCDALAGVEEPGPALTDREATIRDQLAACDRRLAKYHTVLDELEDVSVVARWIADAQRERKRLEAQLGQTVPRGTLTPSQVKALVEALQDIVTVLREADPADRAEAYRALGVSLTYRPDGRVTVEALPRGVNVRVGGGT